MEPNKQIYMNCRFLICELEIKMLSSQGCWDEKGGRRRASERTYMGHMQLRSSVAMKSILHIIPTYENVDTFFFGSVLDELLKNI